jgi:hypothetical protein
MTSTWPRFGTRRPGSCAAVPPGTLIIGGTGDGFAFRCAAILALLMWIAATLGGTVPIKQRRECDPTAPPADWPEPVARRERLNSLVRIACQADACPPLLAGAR